MLQPRVFSWDVLMAKLKANCPGNKDCPCNKAKAELRGHSIQSNLEASETRFEVHEGKTYLVVPIVMAKAGVVMNGSLTDLNELRPEGWNGRPVTVGHPTESGEFHTANDPTKIADWSVGQLFNAKVEDECLKAEAWVDIEKAKKVRPGLLAMLKSKEPMDVSTGFFCVDEEATGNSNGRDYVAISRNWVPDHLALLPDEPGACSFADGCGVRSNRDRRLHMKLTERANKAVKGILAAVGVNNADAKKKVEKELTSLLANERGSDDDTRTIVSDLISNDASPFTPDDEDSLRMMTADTLKKMRDQFLAQADEEEAEEEEVENADDEEKVVDCAEDDEEEEVVPPAKKEKAMSKKKEEAPVLITRGELASLVANEVKKATGALLSNDDRHALKTAGKIATEQKKQLVDKIVANSSIGRKAAEAMDLATLETVANGLTPKADYSGRIVPNASFEDDESEELSGMAPPSTKTIILANRKKKEA